MEVFMEFFKDPSITPSSEASIDTIPIPVGLRKPTSSRSLLRHPDQGGEKVPAGFGVVSDVDVSKPTEKREYALPSGITYLNG